LYCLDQSTQAHRRLAGVACQFVLVVKLAAVLKAESAEAKLAADRIRRSLGVK
jgi:hypothetical protein